jgi:hypothetical protein
MDSRGVNRVQKLHVQLQLAIEARCDEWLWSAGNQIVDVLPKFYGQKLIWSMK